jgi:hypothetical protein
MPATAIAVASQDACRFMIASPNGRRTFPVFIIFAMIPPNRYFVKTALSRR